MLKINSVLAGLISVAVLATPHVSLAQSATTATTTTTTTKKHKAVHKKPAGRTVSEQLEELRRSMQQQNEQIQSLQQQVQQRDSTIQQLQQSVGEAQTSATQAQQAAQTATQQNQQQLQSVQTDLADLKTVTTNSVSTLQETQKRIVDAENPTALHYKGITITPGGFLAAEGLWRQHNETNDVISSFNGMPYNGSINSQLSEFRGSARQSRISLLAEGKLANVKLTGYYEIDFLGAAPTANENQSSSFTPRTRQYWGQADFHNGWTFTAGQTWSLWTSNKKGIATRQEWNPAGIEAQYVVGYDFARLFTVRVTKNINNKMWFAASLENPEMLNPSSLTTPSGIILGPANGATGAAGGTFASTNTLATDFMPDIIAKVAFEPGWGHYEIKGLMRVFRDKFYPGVTSSTTFVANAPSYSDKTVAGGVGVNAILPLVPKKADLILQGSVGEGIGRYSDSTNVDVTYAQDGALIPLKEIQVLAGLELHPTPKLDWYFYGGDEYVRRDWGIGTDGKEYGYGAPAADNSGCQFANAGSLSCKANFRNLQEGTTGFWYRFYKGPAGTMQWGLQYEWVHKNTWAGTNVGDPLATTTPKASENIVMTSFRYVLP